MRIIGGKYKGKKLFLPKDKETRPLKDLVKESIFNLIQHSNKINVEIKNATILDLFSGTGSFGLECISREAKKTFFVENYTEAVNILDKNAKSLTNDKTYKIFNKDCFTFLNSYLNLNTKFDIIFIDPPYKEQNINEIIESVLDKNILNKDGIMIIHRHKKDNIKITERLDIFESRNYGISKILFGN